MSQNRLGRGLSALIPQKPTKIVGIETPTNPDTPSGGGVAMIALDKIHPSPTQPRITFDLHALDELAASIKSKGIIQPILVRPKREVPDNYEVIAGERRFRAAEIAGLTQIPALIRQLQDQEATELALIENVQREDLKPIERAAAYRNYINAFHISPDELSLRLGESRASVVNYMRLLNLGDEILQMIDRGELGMGQARAILGVTSTERRLAIAKLAARRNLSVRQVEELASRTEADGDAAELDDRAATRRHINEVERTLATSMGLKVTLQTGRKKNAGRVIIHYNSLDDFDRIARQLGAPTTVS